MRAIIAGDITIQFSNPADARHPVIRTAMAENTFTNPVFAEAKRMGRYLGGTPQFIHLFRQYPDGITLPRGYGRRLLALEENTGTKIFDLVDHRVESPAAFPERLVGTETRHYQTRTIHAMLERKQGVGIAPTGSGKTVTALEIIRRRSQRTVILVHSRILARQWVRVIQEKMGVDAGFIGDGRWTAGREITVAILHSLHSRMAEAKQLARGTGMVVMDEGHHAPAGMFSQVIGLFPALYRYAFTATPKRGDGLMPVIYRLFGDVLATVHPDEVEQAGGIVPARVDILETGCIFPGVDASKKDARDARDARVELVNAMAGDGKRNAMIARMATAMSREHAVLVLTERVEHAETLAAMIPGALMIHGQLPARERELRMGLLPKARLVVGTRGLFGEGVDISVWSCLIMATPISGETSLLQAVGRVIRPAPGKTMGVVIDLVDHHPLTLNGWKRRATVYRSRKWAVQKIKEFA